MGESQPVSRYAREAALLLGRRIRLGRKERRWSEQALAERAGLSRGTLQKIEKGDLSVAVGSVFEVAVLVGVSLFDEEPASLPTHIARTDDRLSLLPSASRKRRTIEVDDDF
jgi:transcriptional regulator with XRE-family HTH domain